MSMGPGTDGMVGHPVAVTRISRQGQLDSLCGPYAIVNALMLVAGDDARRPGLRKQLFAAGVAHMAEEGVLADACTEGMAFRQLCRLFKAVAAEMEALQGITIAYRVAVNRRVGINEFIGRMSAHLTAHGPGSIILNVSGDIEHWTVVSAIDAKRVHLADCYGFRFFKRASLTTDKERTLGRRHELWPTQSLLLRRAQ